jgi:protein-tyrosine phosphatase
LEVDVRVLMVCLGNICRSPTAEAVLRHALAARGLHGWEVDSAGTSGHHAGEPADPRAVATLRRAGIACDVTSRQVVADDFERFDVILAMDRHNLATLRAMCPPRHLGRLALALEPIGGGDVPDPYYGGADGFERVHALLDQAIDRWLDRWCGETPHIA